MRSLSLKVAVSAAPNSASLAMARQGFKYPEGVNCFGLKCYCFAARASEYTLSISRWSPMLNLFSFFMIISVALA